MNKNLLCIICGKRNAYYTRDSKNVCKWCNETEIKCRTCGVTKPVDQFHFIRKRENRRNRECKKCAGIRSLRNQSEKIHLDYPTRCELALFALEKGTDAAVERWQVKKMYACVTVRWFIRMDPREQATFLFRRFAGH